MRAHHEACGVVQEQQWRAGLVAELDELGGFRATRRCDRAVVADDANGVTLNANGAAYGLVVELVLEVHELRTVSDAGQDFTHVVRLFGIRGNNAQQLLCRMHWLVPCQLALRRELLVPRQRFQNVSGLADAVGVVFGQVFGGARNLCVHFCSAKFFVSRYFSSCGFQQWRAGQEHFCLAADSDHVVRQAWLIGAASSGVAVHYRNLWQPGCGHASLIGEAACALHKNIGGVVQVGAAAL